MKKLILADAEVQKKALLSFKPPDPSSRQVSKKEYFKAFRKEVIAVQKMGYTLEEIAKALSESGFSVTKAALNTLLAETNIDKKPRVSNEKISKKQNTSIQKMQKKIETQNATSPSGRFTLDEDTKDL